MHRPMTFVLALGLFTATLGPAAVASAQQQQPADSPRQGWAQKDGFFILKPATPITPQSVADRLMIQDAFNRWAIAYDDGQLDVIRTLFTPKGTLEATAASATRLWVNTGADEILAAVKRDRASQSDQRRHAISNVVIDTLDGTHASAAAYGVVTVASRGDLYLGATVLYLGELEKQTDGNWRFTKLVIGLDAYKRPAPAGTSTTR